MAMMSSALPTASFTGTFAMSTSEGTMRKPPPAPMSDVSTPTPTASTPSAFENRNSSHPRQMVDANHGGNRGAS
jgi:hypothetical protein